MRRYIQRRVRRREWWHHLVRCSQRPRRGGQRRCRCAECAVRDASAGRLLRLLLCRRRPPPFVADGCSVSTRLFRSTGVCQPSGTQRVDRRCGCVRHGAQMRVDGAARAPSPVLLCPFATSGIARLSHRQAKQRNRTQRTGALNEHSGTAATSAQRTISRPLLRQPTNGVHTLDTFELRVTGMAADDGSYMGLPSVSLWSSPGL